MPRAPSRSPSIPPFVPSSQNTEEEAGYSRWAGTPTADGKTAESILMEWLTEGDNYAKMKGYKNASRLGQAEEILCRIDEAGIGRGQKTPAQVLGKVSHVSTLLP